MSDGVQETQCGIDTERERERERKRGETKGERDRYVNRLTRLETSTQAGLDRKNVIYLEPSKQSSVKNSKGAHQNCASALSVIDRLLSLMQMRFSGVHHTLMSLIALI